MSSAHLGDPEVQGILKTAGAHVGIGTLILGVLLAVGRGIRWLVGSSDTRRAAIAREMEALMKQSADMREELRKEIDELRGRVVALEEENEKLREEKEAIIAELCVKCPLKLGSAPDSPAGGRA